LSSINLPTEAFELRLPCRTAVIADIWVENAMLAIRPGVAAHYSSAICERQGGTSIWCHGSLRSLHLVMRGLDPRIHHLRKTLSKKMDCRVKPGNDENVQCHGIS
jgi:hypothetical protein